MQLCGPLPPPQEEALGPFVFDSPSLATFITERDQSFVNDAFLGFAMCEVPQSEPAHQGQTSSPRAYFEPLQCVEVPSASQSPKDASLQLPSLQPPSETPLLRTEPSSASLTSSRSTSPSAEATTSWTPDSNVWSEIVHNNVSLFFPQYSSPRLAAERRNRLNQQPLSRPTTPFTIPAMALD